MARKGKAPPTPSRSKTKKKKCSKPCLKIYEEFRSGILMERRAMLLAKKQGISAQSLGALARLSKGKAK